MARKKKLSDEGHAGLSGLGRRASGTGLVSTIEGPQNQTRVSV